MNRTPTLVFPPGVEPEIAIGATEEVLGEATRGESAGFVKIFEKSPSPSITVHRWVHDGDETVVDLTVDRATPALFLSVMSSRGADVGKRATQLRELLDLPTAAEYTDDAARTMDPTVIVLAALASEAGFSAGLGQLVDRALKHEDRSIRAAGVHAAALLEWRELLPSLLRLREREPDQEIVRLLDVAIAKCGE